MIFVHTCMCSHVCLQVGTFEVSFSTVFKRANVISSAIGLALRTFAFLLILALKLRKKSCLSNNKISLL